MTRELDWEGCLNVRDLGGIPLEDGRRRTRPGVLIRSDNVRNLTDAGWATLAAHGVVRLVDLRWREELAEDPPRHVDVEVVHVSLLGHWDPSVDDGVDQFLPARDVTGYREHMYTRWLRDYRTQFAQALAAIADAEGPVVFHCAAGKDRTGLVAALLLRLAGVPIDEIAADYALSERAFLRGDEEPELHFLRATPAEGMARTLAFLERTYGSAAKYLCGGGVTDEQLARLEERLAAP